MQCVEEDPRYAPAWARLGRIHHVMGKYLPTGTQQGLVQAEAAFRRALEVNPDLTIAHKLFAQLEVDLGRAHDAMVRLIERAHTADPELLAGLVSACRYCGLLDASVAAHARALELEPQDSYERGPHVVSAGRPRARRHRQGRGVPLHRGDIVGGARARSKRPSPSCDELEQKIPTRLRDFILAARTLLEGRPAESIAAVGRVVASDFRDPEGLFYLSRHLAHLNETGAALDLFERVVAGGFFCFPAMARDPWLDSLRRKPAFTRLLRQAEAQHQEASAAFERASWRQGAGPHESFVTEPSSPTSSAQPCLRHEIDQPLDQLDLTRVVDGVTRDPKDEVEALGFGSGDRVRPPTISATRAAESFLFEPDDLAESSTRQVGRIRKHRTSRLPPGRTAPGRGP